MKFLLNISTKSNIIKQMGLFLPILLFTLLFMLLIIQLYNLFFKKKTIESMVFNSDGMRENIYDKYNISLNEDEKYLKKDGKKIYYKNLNNKKNAKNAHNKYKAAIILQENNLPVSKFYKWDFNISNQLNLDLIKKLNIKYPLVIKDVNGERGKHVYTDITNVKELLKNIKIMKKENIKQVMVEEQIKGNKYRIMVLNNDIIFISHHTTPIIVGDGEKTIKELINEYPVKYNLNPIEIINEDLINQQGYKLDSIPEKNKKIKVTNILSVLNGGKNVDINVNEIPPVNVNMFKRVNQIFGINFSGIDYISPDIRIPYFSQGKILEVNTGPSFSISNQKSKKIADKWVNAIFHK